MKPFQRISWLKKILTKLNGLHYPQEYLCFAKGSLQNPIHVYLVNNKQVLKEITNEHLFVGYCPLVFAFPVPALVNDSGLPQSIQLIFSQQLLYPNEIFRPKDAIASLGLATIEQPTAGDRDIVFYEGTRGKHHFLPGFHQWINRLHNQLYNKKTGNVFLYDNLYKQVQIAYAVARNISLITVCNNELFNLFPTDLHGQITEQHYIISLRVGGKALEQVEKAGKLLISKVHSDAYKMVYGLGKNHMQEPKSIENFPFGRSRSSTFNWPLPEHTLSYKELILMDSFIHDIHKILLFSIVFRSHPQGQNSTLAHIHNSYASWRYKNGFPGNYLLR